MDFETKEATYDYLEMYKRDSPTLQTDAETLSMIKITETSFVGVSVYPNEEVCNFAESRNSREPKHLLRRISDCLKIWL
tara:strand:- start:61 stop:297 length:237 start_codon:yes stop_codon:yes gene_type:complete